MTQTNEGHYASDIGILPAEYKVKPIAPYVCELWRGDRHLATYWGPGAETECRLAVVLRKKVMQ